MTYNSSIWRRVLETYCYNLCNIGIIPNGYCLLNVLCPMYYVLCFMIHGFCLLSYDLCPMTNVLYPIFHLTLFNSKCPIMSNFLLCNMHTFLACKKTICAKTGQLLQF